MAPDHWLFGMNAPLRFDTSKNAPRAKATRISLTPDQGVLDELYRRRDQRRAEAARKPFRPGFNESYDGDPHITY